MTQDKSGGLYKKHFILILPHGIRSIICDSLPTVANVCREGRDSIISHRMKLLCSVGKRVRVYLI